jgi:hypothetical protein
MQKLRINPNEPVGFQFTTNAANSSHMAAAQSVRTNRSTSCPPGSRNPMCCSICPAPARPAVHPIRSLWSKDSSTA